MPLTVQSHSIESRLNTHMIAKPKFSEKSYFDFLLMALSA
jgi:hypothetical protein